MRNKGQTAMEYLMTYGWAILIVIVVVAALFAMGVFRIGAGTKCSPCFPAGGDFTFTDQNGVDITLKIGPRDVTFDPAFTVSGTPDATNNIQLTGGVQDGAAAGQSSGCDTSTTWSGDCVVNIVYTVTETGLSHTASATLHQ